MIGIGIMSGTSLDGVDIVISEIKNNWLDTKVEVKGFETYPLPEETKLRIKKACSFDESTSELISSLNFELGKLFAGYVIDACKTNGFELNEIDFVATHGQTIFHIPKDTATTFASTLQIGEPAVIAYETGIQVISNFRVMDMAAGGEGAPLVPYSEYILYASDSKASILQNIGGIGNLTCIPASAKLDDVFAFDTGPGNMIIDEAMHQLFSLPYDDGGKIAASGTINDEMLAELMAHPYIDAPTPKTTGREDFGQQFVLALIDKYKHVAKEDFIATVTEFTAASIAHQYKKYVFPLHHIDDVIIGGGGAHNKHLLKRLADLMPNVSVLTQEDVGYSSDLKEALAFVILGNETLHHHFSNVPSSTGAKDRVILGNITPSPIK